MQSYCSYAGKKERKTQKNKEQILIRKQYDRQIRKQRKEKKKKQCDTVPDQGNWTEENKQTYLCVCQARKTKPSMQ